jgi:hypothetical protein
VSGFFGAAFFSVAATRDHLLPHAIAGTTRKDADGESIVKFLTFHGKDF